MYLELPPADGLVCENLGERDGQAVPEKPLARLTLHIKPCRKRQRLKAENKERSIYDK